MITTRFITQDDYPLLCKLIMLDEYHSKDTSPSFFYEDGTICTVYEDDAGPILFLRGKSIVHEGIGMIQLDIQYVDNKDGKRNLKAMSEGFPVLESNARENGWSGFFFTSTSPLLRKFCVKRLGFKEHDSELLVKIFQET
jgi:hypothetical protein